MPKWLYEESMEALDRYMDIRHGDSLEYHPGMDREKLEALQKIAKCNYHKNYPRRPSAKEKLPEDSAAVVQFRECLSYCRVSVSKDVNSADAKVQFHRDMFTGDASYQLTKGYKDEIKACLKEIGEKCGDTAKILAKWEVRDEVCQGLTTSSIYSHRNFFPRLRNTSRASPIKLTRCAHCSMHPKSG